MRRSIVVICVALGPLFVIGPIRVGSTFAADAPPEFVSPYQACELKLKTYSPLPNRPMGVLVYGRINGGRPLGLILDSAADEVVIGAKTARSAGIIATSDIDLVGPRNRPARVGLADTLEVGPVRIRNCRVVLVNGDVIEGADGVIPLSLFSGFLLQLDFPGKALRLIPYTRQRSQPYPPNGRAENRNRLLVPAVLNGKQSGQVILDTAAYCSVVSRDVAGALGGFPDARLTLVWAGTGATWGWIVSPAVHFLIAGKDAVSDETVVLDLSNLSRHYGLELLGIVGFPALRPYVLTIDYQAGRLTIEPPQHVPASEASSTITDNSPTQLALR